jgi:hypothetical protein
MTANSNRSGNFLLGLSLAVGLIISAFIVSDTVRSVKMQNQTIEVKGY